MNRRLDGWTTLGRDLFFPPTRWHLKRARVLCRRAGGGDVMALARLLRRGPNDGTMPEPDGSILVLR